MILAFVLAGSVIFSTLLREQISLFESADEPAGLPQRVISTSPAITEVLFALGAGERVVGVTDYCNYPPEAKNIERIGGTMNPSLEKLMSLEPDLVILGNLSERDHADYATVGLPVLVVREYTMPEIKNMIRSIGDTLGVVSTADSIVVSIESAMAASEKAVSDSIRKSVMLVIGRTPGALSDIYVVGSGVFLNDLVEAAGGRNVFSDLHRPYARVSTEEILVRRPDVIIEAAHNIELTPEKVGEMRKVWSPLGMVPAVVNREIHFINDDFLLIPGPRMVLSLKRFQQLIYPVKP